MSLDVNLEIEVDTGGDEPHRVELFWRNITHNLNRMAEDAGVYRHCWEPSEVGITLAGQLVKPLTDAISKMEADPDRFKQHNPPNGWGDYSGLLDFLRAYRDACRKHPKAKVRVCG